MTLKIEEIEVVSKEVLEKQGHHSPQIMFELNGKINIGILKFENDIEKNLMMKSMRELIHKEKINSYVIIMEAWISTRHSDDTTPYIRPKLDPKRKECLIVSIYNRDMTTDIINNIFERDGKKIKWVDRQTNKELTESKSMWNFYLEDLSNKEFEEYFKKNK